MVLAGPKSVTLFDPTLCSYRDLGSNFYITEEDVEKRLSRATACAKKLQQLNPYVKVDVLEPSQESRESRLPQLLSAHDTLFDVVVLCDAGPASQTLAPCEVSQINALCREKAWGFISIELSGLAGGVFVDFGKDFLVRDKDGEDPKSCIVSMIVKDEDGFLLVTVHQDSRHPFQDGDFVSFTEVQGMSALNELSKPGVKVRVLSPYSFKLMGVFKKTGAFTSKIEPIDIGSLSNYTREGQVSLVKIPTHLKFRSFESARTNPFGFVCGPYSSLVEKGEEEPDAQPCLPVLDLAKFGRPEQLHVAFEALRMWKDELFKTQGPVKFAEAVQNADFRFDDEFQGQVLKLAKKANDAQKTVLEFDAELEKTVLKVARYGKSSLSPMSAFFGGVVAQEVVKFTGKYTPAMQFLYHDSFEALVEEEDGDEFRAKLSDPEERRFQDQIEIFGRKFQNKLSGLKLFVVGAGALGCEFLKGLALMGACRKTLNGKMTVTDMDRIEVSNLNRQFLFHQQHVGKPKSVCAAEAARTMSGGKLDVEALETRVGADTEEIFDDVFWEGIDCVVNALDNIQARLYSF